MFRSPPGGRELTHLPYVCTRSVCGILRGVKFECFYSLRAELVVCSMQKPRIYVSTRVQTLWHVAGSWCCLGLAREIATSWQDARVRWVCAARKREAPGIFSSAPGRFSNFAKDPPPSLYR